MNHQLFKDAFGWGILLWLIGYVLGIILFMILPATIIGWIIMPIGIFVTLWVLFKKVKGITFRYYLFLAFGWTLIAVIFDYFFLVKVFKPIDGYYKPDVYMYYVLTFAVPLISAWRKKAKL